MWPSIEFYRNYFRKPEYGKTQDAEKSGRGRSTSKGLLLKHRYNKINLQLSI